MAPSLFTANDNGKGAPAAATLSVAADGSRRDGAVFRCGTTPGSCVPEPIDRGPEGQQVFVILYGTGIRGFSAPVSATLGGVNVPVLAAVPHGVYAGLDQVNIGPLPRALGGRSELDLVITVDGRPANAVKLNIR